ncbi:hypothetical protein E2C01_034196 [Portunus trituberculatus]|uniref:Uncharacterized protein n=1 Tax=Portunus trituberculatus TaxID=210409 RepID=A0A5B7F6F6_PORTR|nr:hypothetical protein [Portunus trituberculatus]
MNYAQNDENDKVTHSSYLCKKSRVTWSTLAKYWLTLLGRITLGRRTVAKRAHSSPFLESHSQIISACFG